MIYFIIKIDSNKKEFVKIGYSQKSEKRLKQLQTGSSERLTIFCEIDGDKKLEKKLHKVWWKNRVRDDGEWFDLSAGLRMWLGRVREIGGYIEPNQIELFYVPSVGVKPISRHLQKSIVL